MISETPLDISDAPSVDDQRELERRLDEHNIEHTGIRDARLLSIMLRSPAGTLDAGLYGHTWGGCCEIKTLWVAATRRGEGLGRRLMHTAEDEAVRRGCTRIVLSTHSFQAPDFYARLGFRQVASIEDCPTGHSHILMMKRIGRTEVQ